jgi:TP901 family phage tail tape measure protein
VGSTASAVASLIAQLDLDSALFDRKLAGSASSFIAFADTVGVQSARLQAQFASLTTSASTATRDAIAAHMALGNSASQSAALVLDAARKTAIDRSNWDKWWAVEATKTEREYTDTWKSLLAERDAHRAKVAATEKARSAEVQAQQKTELAGIEANVLAEARLRSEATARRITIEEDAALRRAELAERELGVYRATLRAQVEAEREAAVERRAIQTGVARTAYTMGGYHGGRAASLAMFNPGVAAAAAGILATGYAVKQEFNLEEELARATAGMKGAIELQAELRNATLEWSQKSKFSAVEIAHAYGQIQMAGYSAAEAIQLLSVFIPSAAAAAVPLGEHIRSLTAAQQANNLHFKSFDDNMRSLKFVADSAAAAYMQGGMSIEQFLNALHAVGPEAIKHNVSLGETLALLRLLGLQEIEGAKSGEITARVMVSVGRAVDTSRDAWQRLTGIHRTVNGTLVEANGTELTITRTLELLAGVVQTNNAGLNDHNSNLLGLQMRSDRYTQALISMVGSHHDLSRAIDDVTGSYDRLAKARQSGPETQIGMAWKSIKAGIMTVGEPIGWMLMRLKDLSTALDWVGRATIGNVGAGAHAWWGLATGQPPSWQSSTAQLGNLKTNPTAPGLSVEEATAASVAAATFIRENEVTLEQARLQLRAAQSQLKDADAVLKAAAAHGGVGTAEVTAATEKYKSALEDVRRLTAQIDGLTETAGRNAEAAERKKQAELDRTYRIAAIHLSDEEAGNAWRISQQRKMVEAQGALTEEEVIDRANKLRTLNGAELAARKDIIDKMMAQDRGASNPAVTAQLESERHRVIREWMSRELDIHEWEAREKGRIREEDSKSELNIRRRQQEEEDRDKERRQVSAQRASQEMERGTRDHAVRSAELYIQGLKFQESRGDISRRELLSREQAAYDKEDALNKASLDSSIRLLETRTARTYDENEKLARLKVESQALDDRIASRREKANQDEARGLTDVTRAIEDQVAARKRMAQDEGYLRRSGTSTSTQTLNLSHESLTTSAYSTYLKGMGGVYSDIEHAGVRAFSNIGHSLVSALTSTHQLGKGLLDLGKSIVTEIAGTAVQSLLKLGASWLWLKVIEGDVNRDLVKSSYKTNMDIIIQEAAVAGAKAAEHMASVPFIGPFAAVAAGLAMSEAIMGTFGGLASAGTMEHGGDVRRDMMVTVHAGEHVLNRDISESLRSMMSRGPVGGGIVLDFSGSTFHGVPTRQVIDPFMNEVVSRLRSSGQLSRTGTIG